MTIKAGLIGYGLAGRLLHAPVIRAAGMEINAIASSRAEQVRADFPDAAVTTPEDLVRRDDVDVAIVVTPDHMHVPHARMALEAGKHVVIDKPMAPTSAEALSLIDLAAQRGRMLTVYQNRRWDADFLTIQKLVTEGALGEIAHYAARWDRYRPNARGTWHDEHMLGELFGLGPHLVDQALVLFGAPDWLWADVYNQRGAAGMNDGFEILMGKGNLRISLAINMMAADELKSCRVLGAKAAFTKSGLDPQEPHLRARGAVSDPAFGYEDEAHWGVLTEDGKDSRIPTERGNWLVFYQGVRASIETGAAPPVDPRDSARNIAILEAALESTVSGRRIDLKDYLAQRGLA
jgi:scyllo-inositol 2-dehydrogenase (NADP+)